MASKLGVTALYVTPHSGKWGVLDPPGPPGSPPLFEPLILTYDPDFQSPRTWKERTSKVGGFKSYSGNKRTYKQTNTTEFIASMVGNHS